MRVSATPPLTTQAKLFCLVNRIAKLQNLVERNEDEIS